MEWALALLGLSLMALALFSGRRNVVSNHSSFETQQELQRQLEEARLVQEDLSRMLQLATQTSESMVNKLSGKLEEAKVVLEVFEDQVIGDRHSAHPTGSKREVHSVEVHAPDLHSPGEAEVEDSEGDELQLENQVLRLDQAGYSPQEIAQILDVGTGEVQLILALHKKR